MSEGWSVSDENPWIPRKLAPSDGPTIHIDPRMHLKLDDMQACYNPPISREPKPPIELVMKRNHPPDDSVWTAEMAKRKGLDE